MTQERLKELDEKYKDRNLLDELAYMMYYTKKNMSVEDLEFACWLYYAAYKYIVESNNMFVSLLKDYKKLEEEHGH